MKFRNNKLSLEEAKQIDLVDYLASLGHHPSKVRNSDYWYLSPLRKENTPSFKVNRKLNRWYDHGIGEGGSIIDFATQYHGGTIGEILHKLNPGFFFHSSPIRSSEPQPKERKIEIIEDSPLSSSSLIRYLALRKIPYEVASQFCREVWYQVEGKTYYAIGFINDSGGYEIRNPYFKGSTSPKDITTFNNGAPEVAIFEGFIDFLSFIAIHHNQEKIRTDFVILNSLSLFEKARPFMEQHNRIRLYLDRDAAGQNCRDYALSLSKTYTDESSLYNNYKDLNDWLVNFGKGQKRKQGLRP